MGTTGRQQIIGVFLTVVAVVGIPYVLSLREAPEDKLARLWVEDLKTLKNEQKLPAEWVRIRTVKTFAGTERAKKWMKTLVPPAIDEREDGDHELEILLLDWEQAAGSGAIVQYNLIDQKSGNMIWELGRTFHFNNDTVIDRQELSYKIRKEDVDSTGTAISNPAENQAEEP